MPTLAARRIFANALQHVIVDIPFLTFQRRRSAFALVQRCARGFPLAHARQILRMMSFVGLRIGPRELHIGLGESKPPQGENDEG